MDPPESDFAKQIVTEECEVINSLKNATQIIIDDSDTEHSSNVPESNTDNVQEKDLIQRTQNVIEENQGHRKAKELVRTFMQ